MGGVGQEAVAVGLGEQPLLEVFVGAEVSQHRAGTALVERDGQLLTPPVSSGALPGVLRAQLLASGCAREAVLYPADLAQGFWLGNALRGLVPVRLLRDGVKRQSTF